MFPQKHALPSAEAKTTIYEGDDLGRAGERHLDVARHIIRAFIIEWNHPLESQRVGRIILFVRRPVATRWRTEQFSIFPDEMAVVVKSNL